MSNLKLYVIIAFALVFAILSISMGTCIHKTKEHRAEIKRQEQIAQNNYKAFNDTIKVLKNKANEEYYTKQAFIFENSKLKEQNLQLSKVVVKYKQDLSQAAIATITIRDTIPYSVPIMMDDRVQELQVKDSVFDVTFTATVTDTTTLLSNFKYSIRIPVFVAFEHDAKHNQARVIFSSYPNVTFSNIEAYTVPYPPMPRKKWFAIGAHLGAGIGMAKTQDGYKPIITPVISIGINFNPIQF